ncbi:MAG TPA: nitroreductase [Ilumatobacteraceae bacterium]|nr:nitroreductase [Ilumatobacteraceae bacterium]
MAPLLTRQSIVKVTDQAPDDDQIEAILRAAVTVPDHGAVRPWRLVVVSGDARHAFGNALSAAGQQARVDMPDQVLERLRSKAFVAPALIAVVARIVPESGIDVWEQVASAACAGYAITLAAHQLGLGAVWKSSPFRDGAELRRVLDMGEHDEFLGWVNLGGIPQARPASKRPEIDLTEIARALSPEGVPTPYQR